MRSKVFYFIFLSPTISSTSKADFITYISTDRKTSLGEFEIKIHLVTGRTQWGRKNKRTKKKKKKKKTLKIGSSKDSNEKIIV